jgi:hypothetical protein
LKAGAEIPVTARATEATAADGTVIAAATETIVVTAVGVANLKTTERAQRGCIPEPDSPPQKSRRGFACALLGRAVFPTPLYQAYDNR